MRTPHTHRIAGFTLVEVLVAMVVMAIMSLLAWQGVDGIVRTRTASQARLDLTLRLDTVLEQWEQDLNAMQVTTAAPTLACDGKNVRMTRRTDAGLQIVDWSLQPGEHGGTWQRWSGPAYITTNELQQSWLSTQQFQGGEPGQLRAIAGVGDWQVYFFRGNSWSNCQSSGGMPSGVRIVLTFTPESGLSGSLTRDVLIAP